MKFKVGEEVIVTGDSGRALHNFPTGTQVRIMEDPNNNKHLCRCEYLDGHDYWWVNSKDLEPIVSESEVQAAIASILERP